MATNPTSDLAMVLDSLRTLIATSSTFQTWTSTASVALAKVRVYGFAEASPTRPCAYVGWVNGRVKRGGYISGQLKVIFEMATAAAYQQAGAEATDFLSAAYDFVNSAGQVLEDMMEQSEAPGYLFIPARGIDFQQVARTDREDQTDYHQLHCTIPYGLDSNP